MILRSLTSQGKSTPEFRLAIIAIVVFVAMAALSPDRFSVITEHCFHGVPVSGIRHSGSGHDDHHDDRRY